MLRIYTWVHLHPNPYNPLLQIYHYKIKFTILIPNTHSQIPRYSSLKMTNMRKRIRIIIGYITKSQFKNMLTSETAKAYVSSPLVSLFTLFRFSFSYRSVLCSYIKPSGEEPRWSLEWKSQPEGNIRKCKRQHLHLLGVSFIDLLCLLSVFLSLISPCVKPSREELG